MVRSGQKAERLGRERAIAKSRSGLRNRRVSKNSNATNGVATSIKNMGLAAPAYVNEFSSAQGISVGHRVGLLKSRHRAATSRPVVTF
jgi:hypothetical protein